MAYLSCFIVPGVPVEYRRGGRGFFEFNDRGWGEFQFGYVRGYMDCRLTTREGVPAVEWTWDGNDEMDPAQGRGWAVVQGDEMHDNMANIDLDYGSALTAIAIESVYRPATFGD